MDDDVQTDDGIMRCAKLQCENDVYQAIECQKKFATRNLVKDVDIERRCKYPHLFDRTGTFI